MGDLDREIAEAAAEGYCVDVLLEDRADWQAERDALMESLNAA
jgi:hypothetical protein